MLGITDFWTYVLGTVAIVLLPGPNSILVLSVAAQRGVRAGYRAASGVFIGDTVLMVLAAAGVTSVLKAYPPIFMAVKYAGGAYLAWVGLGIIRGAWRTWRERGRANGNADRRVGVDEVQRDADQVGTHYADQPGSRHVDQAGSHYADQAGSRFAKADQRGADQRSADQRSADQRSADQRGTDQRGTDHVVPGMARPFRRALIVSLLNPKAILFVVSFFIQFVEPGYAHPAVSFLILGAILQVFSFLYLTGLIFGGQFLAGQFRRRRRLSAAAATGVGAVFVGFGVKLATATAG